MSWLGRLKDAKAEVAAQNSDPWRLRLERVQGKVDFDGFERVSSQTLLDLLEVPQKSRKAGTCRRLARLMAELGWRAVRVRDLTGGGYKEQVRGYCRDARHRRPSAAGREQCADHNTITPSDPPMPSPVR
jgi:hypothetical protein